MPAAPKVTPEQIAEIMRRRSAGESYTTIGDDLGFPHSTISRSHQKEQTRLAEEQAKADAGAAAERAWDEYIRELENGWEMDFDRYANGPLYPTWEYCLEHWDSRKNIAPSGRQYHLAMLDYNTVAHRGEYLPIEVEAMSAGRQPYMYPPGSRKSLEAA